jgi:hypothetical protein
MALGFRKNKSMTAWGNRTRDLPACGIVHLRYGAMNCDHLGFEVIQ